jgi:hypothetical protein
MASQQTLNVTELDFDQIKENLVTFFSNSESPFTDWNYSGSGLNILIDALAYNTHYNAMLAHLSVSEGFIDSAQLRSSVVSLAKLLGYTPRSYVAPTASVSLSFTPTKLDVAPGTISIPKGTPFSSVINDKRYVFVTDDTHTIALNDGKYETSGVKIRQGYYQTKRFQINKFSERPRSSYVIDDEKIDLSTLIVKVFASASSSVPEIYMPFDDISGLDEKSTIYFINENTDSNYQIAFGNDVIGKAPKNLAIVELSYLVTEGSDANLSNAFTFAGVNPTPLIRVPTVTTESKAAGGNKKETVESVRYNAPLSFVTQNRAVTADDYKNLIYKNFGEADTISVWGGEDNVPPIYGKVFIAIKPKGANTLTTVQKTAVTTFLKSKKVIGIFPELVDPEFVSLTLDVFFKYNKSLLSLSKGQIESVVRDVVNTYNTDSIQSFDGVFRYSSLSSSIDASNPAILNSHIRVFVTKQFSLSAALPEKKTIRFSTQLVPDDGQVIISSSSFRFNGNEMFFADEEIAGVLNKNLRRVYTYYYKNSVKTKFNADAGSLNMDTGELLLNEIPVDSDVVITLDLMPISNDIAPRHNQLLQIDMTRLFIQGEVDTAGSSTSSYTTFKRDR